MRQEPPPWVALGISRATWYRLGKPERKPPPRLTQAQNARDADISVRTLQRAIRVSRFAPDLVPQVQAGTLNLRAAERIIKERQEEEARAWLRAHLPAKPE